MPEAELRNPPNEPAPPSRIPWPPLVLLAVIAAAIALGQLYQLPWPGSDDLPAQIIGLSIGGGGIILAGWAAWSMRQAGTTIKPHKSASALVTSGPFARLRNPIYVADVMILLGVAELTKNLWFVVGAAIFGVLVTYLAILPEERHLEFRFGDAYRDYKSRSRRWL
ncbi:MAG: protein-S-isoprenylcysteine O-methyltransferase Ste14 [Hyphomicrobiaceae bacterium]